MTILSDAESIVKQSHTAAHTAAWRGIVRGFARHGGRFTKLRRGSKGAGMDKGWNRPENTLDAAAALAQLDAGDNIGLAAGAGDIYCFDLDADAHRALNCPELAETIHTYRENAPDRAKVFFVCRDRVPRRAPKDGVEICGWTGNDRHWQAVIAGIHNSGAPILWAGDRLVELDGATVARLWESWTGTELFPIAGATGTGDFALEIDPDAPTADLIAAAIDRSASMGRNNAGFALAAALRDRRVDPDAALEAMLAYQSRVNRPKDPYTPAEAKTSLQSAFSRPPRSQRPALDDAAIAAYAEWLGSPAAIARLKLAGFRNPERARKLLDAILQRVVEWGRMDVAPGYRWLSEQTMIASGGLASYLARLFDAGLIEIVTGENPGDAMTIIPVFHNLNTLAVRGDISVREQPGGGVQVVKNWNLYREYRPDEIMVNNHYAYTVTRPNATLKPLGDNGLGILTALDAGPLTTAQAAQETGYSYQAAARTLRRFVEHELVDVEIGERNRKTYTLKDDWRDRLDANRRCTTTYGLAIQRREKHIAGKLAYLCNRVERPPLAKLDALETQLKQTRALAAFVRADAGIVPYVPPQNCPIQARLRRLAEARLVGERAMNRPPSRELAGKNQADIIGMYPVYEITTNAKGIGR